MTRDCTTYISRMARMARSAKQLFSYPRYFIQRGQGIAGLIRCADAYQHHVLFIAGLPKSGTSWLEAMLSSLPGFAPVMPPSAVSYEMKNSGSHHMQIPPDLLQDISPGLHVLKLHPPGTLHNAQLLHSQNQNYVIQVRDLRDVAVSHVYYVRNRPWHPDYELFTHRSMAKSLSLFAEHRLEAFVAWCEGWLKHRDPDLSMLVRYEDMLESPARILTNVLKHFGVTLSTGRIDEIVQLHTFQSQTEGRARGDENTFSFYRKGIAGDWRNHFTKHLLNLYIDEAGPLLKKLGYLH